jgi:hypothetical protein
MESTIPYAAAVHMPRMMHVLLTVSSQCNSAGQCGRLLVSSPGVIADHGRMQQPRVWRRPPADRWATGSPGHESSNELEHGICSFLCCPDIKRRKRISGSPLSATPHDSAHRSISKRTRERTYSDDVPPSHVD